MFRGMNPFIEDRAKLDLAYEEWRKKQIPVAKANVQTFITFCVQNNLMNDDDIHAYVREKEDGV